MSVSISKTQARKVAEFMLAYANGKPTQWRPEGGEWRDGPPVMKSRNHYSEWLKTHRVKPTKTKKL